MTITECPRCALLADAHRCAFASGVFDTDNYCCGTLAALRDIANGMQWKSSGDEHAVIFDIDALDADVPDAIFVVLQWYKRRGRTTSAVVLGERGHEPLTLTAAEAIIRACGERTT